MSNTHKVSDFYSLLPQTARNCINGTSANRCGRILCAVMKMKCFLEKYLIEIATLTSFLRKHMSENSSLLIFYRLLSYYIKNNGRFSLFQVVLLFV